MRLHKSWWIEVPLIVVILILIDFSLYRLMHFPPWPEKHWFPKKCDAIQWQVIKLLQLPVVLFCHRTWPTHDHGNSLWHYHPLPALTRTTVSHRHKAKYTTPPATCAQSIPSTDFMALLSIFIAPTHSQCFTECLSGFQYEECKTNQTHMAGQYPSSTVAIVITVGAHPSSVIL